MASSSRASICRLEKALSVNLCKSSPKSAHTLVVFSFKFHILVCEASTYYQVQIYLAVPFNISVGLLDQLVKGTFALPVSLTHSHCSLSASFYLFTAATLSK